MAEKSRSNSPAIPFASSSSDKEEAMAKKRKRKYSKSAGREVKNEMHRYKQGQKRARRQRRQGQESQASHCDRPFQGAQEGKESPQEEVVGRTPLARKRTNRRGCGRLLGRKLILARRGFQLLERKLHLVDETRLALV